MDDQLLKWLSPYISGDDVTLDRLTFLQYVCDRIADDIAAEIRAERRIADHIDGYDRDDLGESPDH